MDGEQVRNRLPRIKKLQINDWRIMIVHNYRRETMFLEDWEDTVNYVVVHGHTHRSKVEKNGNILCVNPGSPVDPIPPFLTKPSIGLLELSKKDVKPRIISL